MTELPANQRPEIRGRLPQDPLKVQWLNGHIHDASGIHWPNYRITEVGDGTPIRDQYIAGLVELATQQTAALNADADPQTRSLLLDRTEMIRNKLEQVLSAPVTARDPAWEPFYRPGPPLRAGQKGAVDTALRLITQASRQALGA